MANGFVPNSILVKLLWPQTSQRPSTRKKEEWKLPSFSQEQMAAIEKVKQVMRFYFVLLVLDFGEVLQCVIEAGGTVHRNFARFV